MTALGVHPSLTAGSRADLRNDYLAGDIQGVPLKALPETNENLHRQGFAGYRVTIGRSPDHIRAAQRLRHQIFAGEFNAITPGPVGLDADCFDVSCDHLVVWFESGAGELAEAVATYRLMPPGRTGDRLYSSTEFDLRAVETILPFTVESGRSCVRADHRNGATMALLWKSIAEYMMRGGYRYLMGCTSVSLADGGAMAASVWEQVQVGHLNQDRICPPLRPWAAEPNPLSVLRLPPLLKGYLRLGATVLGPPAIDPLFNCADFLILLDLLNADPGYLRHFLRAPALDLAGSGQFT